jgi:lycopene beta-cyclase
MPSSSSRAYDVILAGGGAAGLSLAYRLSQEQPSRSILVVDEEVKDRNDHTWCFWSPAESYLDRLAYRTWRQLSIVDDHKLLQLDLAPYTYRMVRAVDFYRFVREALADRPVTFMQGSIAAIADGRDSAEVIVNGVTHKAQWIFDSRYRPADYRPWGGRYSYLTQHFLGWEIETAAPVFDPSLPRLFDFRCPQNGAMRFTYVLPYTPTRGLVEYTVFSRGVLPLNAYQQALTQYIDDRLGASRYHVLSEEQDLIPMTNQPFPRRAGPRTLNIGTRGGRVKASSGYAFRRIQQDTEAIVTSLRTWGHPFDLPVPPKRYQTFDAMLLRILTRRGNLGARIFMQLFERNPVQRIFRFLDEQDGWLENLRLMASVPPVPFAMAWLGLQLDRLWTRNPSTA